jgi:5'-methylthioadenosine phosphorylase
MSGWVLGILGGSGVYELEGLENRRWKRITTPWGDPSDELLFGEAGGTPLVFLPRHGRGHRLSPTEVNARANIDALKRAGCTDVLSLSAVGSLREALEPGAFVLVDQYIDRTFARENTFFGDGVIAHVSMARPVCPRLSAMAAEAARLAGAEVTQGGTYLAMEGPQFSSRAESELYRAWGCDVIGMTNMPEAKLAREAELPYASVCMVTDYDCWRDDAAAVEVGHVLETLMANAAKGRALVAQLAAMIAETPRTPSPIDTVLDNAVITPPNARPAGAVARLDAIAGRVLGRLA